MVIMSQFWPDAVIKEIQKRKISVMCAVPAMFVGMLQSLKKSESYDISSLRFCISGGAPLPIEIIKTYENEYGIGIIEGNGPTETSPLSYINPPDRRKSGSVGPPIEGVQVEIWNEQEQELPMGEIGEICVKGPNVMKGYLNQPEATTQAIRDGWFHTGDLGKVDEEGYVYIVDRKKDMLLIGGYNVYPREVEEVLCQHPGVLEAAVVGKNDEVHGEIPIAYVIPKQNEQVTAKELILFCRKQLANYKCPRKVHLVSELPRIGTGKIDKKQLKEANDIGLI